MKTVLKAVKNKAIINSRDALGRTPIFLACQSGSTKCYLELIKAGADPLIPNDKGKTTLHAPFLSPFLTKGHTKVVQQLVLVKGIDLNALDSSTLTPLQLACSKGAYDAAVVLLQHKADPSLVKSGDPPLYSAVVAENPALVRRLLEAGADISQPNSQGQPLIEVLNPKCEIYRIVKNHLIARPGGARKLQLFAEQCIVATSLAELPPEVLQLVSRSGKLFIHRLSHSFWKIG